MSARAFIERFWGRVERTAEGCWLWTGSRTAGGYGNLRVDGRYDYAHRVAYRLTHGPIPDGLVIDHLCRVRHCVNPGHLEAVTQRLNVLRGAAPYGAIRFTCKRGHDVSDAANVYVDPTGGRRCRACAREENARRTAARRARGDLRKVLKGACSNGHPFDADNTYVAPSGQRQCRACKREVSRRRAMKAAA